MDYPSSDPGVATVTALPFGAEDVDAQSQFQEPQPPWGSAFGSFSLESLFGGPNPDPISNQSLGTTADRTAADLTIGPQTSPSQPVRPPSVSLVIDAVSGPFRFGALREPVPATVEDGAPVSPSTWSNIARQHAANLDRARWYAAQPSGICMPTQNLLTVTSPTVPFDFNLANLGLGLVNSSPNVTYPRLQPPDHSVNLNPFQFQSSSGGPSFHPTFPISGDTGLFPGFTETSGVLPSAQFSAAFDTPGTPTDNGGLTSSSIDCSSYLLSGSQYILSSNPSASHDARNGGYGQSAARSSPNPRRPRAVTKRSVSSLSIVHYRPAEDTEDRPSKKRAALEEIPPQGMVSQTLKPIEGKNGEVQGFMMTLGKRAKKRSTFTKEKREKTALARKEGVCSRCKRSKRQCDLAHQESPYASCTLCAGTKLYKGVARMPCFKFTLEDILFFRSGPASNGPLYTQRRAVYDLGDLSKPHVPARAIKLTQRIGSHRLTVYVSEFTPSPEDVVSYKWRDPSGKQHELVMPNFCLTNIPTVHRHFWEYIESAKWSYLETLRIENDLVWMTVSMAIEYAKRRPDSLVADALSLWAISRMIEIPWEMCGTDTLGVSRINDTNNPRHGKIPIPPNMDTKLDQIVIQLILRPLRKRVIQKFEQLITPAKPESWFEVYLSAFILLHHIERLAKHSAFHARLHTMSTKYSNVPFLEGVFHTAKSILARFHFVCNGSAPLKLDWTSPKTADVAKLQPNQVEFMKKTQAMIAARERDVLSLRTTHRYEESLYWAGQLFFGNFDTSPVHVVEEIEETSVKVES